MRPNEVDTATKFFVAFTSTQEPMRSGGLEAASTLEEARDAARRMVRQTAARVFIAQVVEYHEIAIDRIDLSVIAE